MIIALEDEEWRAKLFREKLGAQVVSTAHSFKLAVERAIATQQSEIAMYVDYDLGPAGTPTGADAVSALFSTGLLRDFVGKLRFIVHSMNERGARSIAARITAAGFPAEVQPFHELLRTMGANIVLL